DATDRRLGRAIDVVYAYIRQSPFEASRRVRDGRLAADDQRTEAGETLGLRRVKVQVLVQQTEHGRYEVDHRDPLLLDQVENVRDVQRVVPSGNHRGAAV